MEELEFHPIANIFPLIDGAELDALVADVTTHGVRETIWLYEGQILDGRNRYRAANAAGKEWRTRTFEGTPLEAIAFVWSLNRTRRHLTPSQAALADARRNQLADVYAPLRDAAKERQVEAGKTYGRGKLRQLVAEAVPDQNKTSQKRAEAAGTNRTYINLADTLVAEHPELAVEVEAGRKTLTQVKRELRREDLLTRTPPAPTGTYRVIYADPPWKYNDALAISKDGLGESYGPADAHYPPMTIAELCALPVGDLADENAVLFLWTTSPFLEDSFQIVRAWGFKYKSSFIWDKVKHNMGHYNSVRHEVLLVCTRGSCLPDVPELVDSVQSIERSTVHSEKPKEFREIIDRLYPNGERIELFARHPAFGWTLWGNDVDFA